MDLMKEALLYGLYCGGLGVGLTMIRSISTYTLKYVFVASFFCGSIYTLVNTLTGWTLLAAFAAAFAAATVIRFFFEKQRYGLYFGLVITSVFCLCPGVAMAIMFDGLMNGDIIVVLSKLEWVLIMAAGLSLGILAAGLVLDRVYGHRVPEELR